MANKRPSPKDLDSPPPPIKQPRLTLAGPTRPTSLTAPTPYIVPSHPHHAPSQLIGISPHPSPSAVAGSLAGITTGAISSSIPPSIRPGMHPLQGQSLMAAHGTPRVSAGIVPTSYGMRMGLTGSSTVPVIHPGIVQQRRPTLIPTQAMTPPPVPLIPPPPYSVSMVMPPASEVPLEQAENTCLSPSQFLHHPTVLQSVSTTPSTTTSPTVVTAATATSSDSTANRQPVCFSTATPSSSSSGKENSKANIRSKRAKILKAYKGKLSSLKLKYDLQLKEKFFLEGGGNMMEFLSWKKKPNILRDQYLNQNKLEAGEPAAIQDHLLSPKDMSQTFIASRLPTEVLKETMKHPITPKGHKSPDKFKTPVSTAPPTLSASASSTTIQIPLSTVSPGLQTSTPKQSTPSSPLKSGQSFHTPSPRPVTRTQTSFSSVYESSHEDIVMRARHEADVKKAIAELRREGLWSACRLPKVVEPSRKKTHWDYLLEEMQWLATDFVNERRWKMNAARKLSRSVARYHQEKEMQQEKTEKEDQLKLRRGIF